MKMTGYIGKSPISIPIDGGSTHNFLDPKTTKKLKCAPEPTQPILVFVANGSQLTSSQQCTKFKWKIGGFFFKDGVRILPLRGCDMVLGVQWLKQLGPTTLFDYNNLTIQFNYGGEIVQLQGLTRRSLPKLKMITLEGIIKHINDQENRFLVVVHLLPNTTSTPDISQITSPKCGSLSTNTYQEL